jgi:hypothetical protein
MKPEHLAIECHELPAFNIGSLDDELCGTLRLAKPSCQRPAYAAWMARSHFTLLVKSDARTFC